MSVSEMKLEINSIKVKLAFAALTKTERTDLTAALLELQSSLIYALEQREVA